MINKSNLTEKELIQGFELKTSPNSKEQYSIGFDVGGTTVKCAIVDKDNNIVAKWFYPTLKDSFINDARTGLKTVLERFNISDSQIVGYGFGVPGKLSKDKKVALEIPNMGFHSPTNLYDAITSVFGDEKAIALNNDVEAALKGEFTTLTPEETKSEVMMITLGTGLGGAYSDTKSIDNVEPGHRPYVEYVRPFDIYMRPIPDRVCGCGNTNCREPFCNTQAVIQDYIEESGNTKILTHPTKDIFDLAKTCEEKTLGDATSEEWAAYRAVLIYKTHLINSIIGCLRDHPSKTFIIGGGISKNFSADDMKFIEDTIQDYFTNKEEQCASDGINMSVSIKSAKLSNDAGVIGNAKDAFEQANRQFPISEVASASVSQIDLNDMNSISLGLVQERVEDGR